MTSLVCLLLILVFSCEEKYYTINGDFYKGKTLSVRNLTNGDDTVRIEQYNTTDRIILEDPDDPSVAFDNRGFIFKVGNADVVSISDEGAIKPKFEGATRVEVVSRADASFSTSFILKVYKDYHKVDRIEISREVTNAVVEKDYTLNVVPYVFIYPGHATNQKLHFTVIDGSQYGEVSDEGIVTGRGEGSIKIRVESDNTDHPEDEILSKEFSITAVNEILITGIQTAVGLDAITLGLGEKLILDSLANVLPLNVNPNNQALDFEVSGTSSQSKISIDPETHILTAIGAGTNARVKITSVRNPAVTKTITVNVDASKKDLTNRFWSVNTSIVYSDGKNYVPDLNGSTNTGKPEHLFDENGATYLCLAKPGKTVEEIYATPSDHTLYFVVDMHFPNSFNAVRWSHRSSGTFDVSLRVWGIDVYGSLDGDTWDLLDYNLSVPYTGTGDTAKDPEFKRYIRLKQQFTYRYVKVEIINYSKTANNTVQIAEFGLSNQ
jgi:hypothetical protein